MNSVSNSGEAFLYFSRENGFHYGIEKPLEAVGQAVWRARFRRITAARKALLLRRVSPCGIMVAVCSIGLQRTEHHNVVPADISQILRRGVPAEFGLPAPVP